MVVFIVATFFRLYNLQSAPPGLYPDEAMNGNNGLEAIATGEYKLFYPENNGREGLFINIQALLLKFSGIREPWVLRSASAAFGILTVLGLFLLIGQIYRIARKDASAGLLAAFSGSFLAAVSFWHINFSRIGFRAIMAPFFIVWSTYFLLKGFETKDVQGKHGKSVFFIILSGLMFGLGMHSYIAYRATPTFILVLFFIYGMLYAIPFKKMLVRFGWFTAGAIITTAPLAWYFIRHPQDFFGRTSQISIFSSGSPLLNLITNIGKSILMFFWFGDSNWRHNFANMGELQPLVALCFLAGIVLGIAAFLRFLKKRSDAERGDSFIFLIAASLFTVALLPTVVSSEGIPHALRAIIMIPAVFLFVAVGVSYFHSKLQKKFSYTTACVWITILFFIIPAAHTYYLYFMDWAHRQEVKDSFAQNYVDLGRELNSLPNAVAKYVIVDTGGVDVRGYPMPTQTVMFMTDTFTPEKQKERNIRYVFPKDADMIPRDAQVFHIR